MAGRIARRPEGEPAPVYAAILDQMRTLATEPPSDDPAENLARLHGLWAIEVEAQDILQTAMARVNQAGPGKLSYSAQSDLFGKHPATIEHHVKAGRKLLDEAAA